MATRYKGLKSKKFALQCPYCKEKGIEAVFNYGPMNKRCKLCLKYSVMLGIEEIKLDLLTMEEFEVAQSEDSFCHKALLKDSKGNV